MLSVRPWLSRLASQLGYVLAKRDPRSKGDPRGRARPHCEPLESRTLPAVYLVTNTLDGGAGSLRQAILDANANAGADVIEFNIPGGGVKTIQPSYVGGGVSLPVITDAVLIDAWSQGGSGYSGPPLIEIDGTNANDASLGSFGFNVQASNTTIRGFAINRFANVNGNGFGIGVFESPDNVWIYGNYVGTNAAGTAAAGNGQGGIWVGSGPTNVRIGTNADGTDDAAERNVISGNAGNGILVQSHGVVIAGNYVGANAAGTAALANVTGIRISATTNRIGTDGDGVNDAAERNVISGNTQYGILLLGNDNKVSGNYVGLNAAGSAAIPNQDGVAIFSATGNVIGTDGSNDAFNANERNLISGNVDRGIILEGVNLAAGNWIGLKADGTVLGNSFGIQVTGTGARVGTNADGVADAAERNVISGNALAGIVIRDATTNGAVIAGNYVGTDATGALARPNGKGIEIIFGAFNNNIGGGSAASRNVISGNAGTGISITGTGTNNNRIQGNLIGLNAAGTAALANGGNGIDVNSGPQGTIIGVDGDGVDDALEGNVISGNAFNGILSYFDVRFMVIAGNFVGADATGTAVIANGHRGILLDAGPSFNRIGSNADGVSDALERNVVSGNTFSGIELAGAGTRFNVVAGNYVGTDVTGALDFGNVFAGVYVQNGATDNTLGGLTAASRNVISGNNGAGIQISGGATMGNEILGNYVGVNAAGSAALGNSGSGILINSGANRNYVGQTAPDFHVASEGTNNVVRYSGVTGALEFVMPNGSGGLTNPRGVIFGPDGNLYVSSRDPSNAILRYDNRTGAFIDAFVTSGSGGLFNPHGITFGPDGNLYVSSQGNKILRYHGTTGAFIDEFVTPGSGGLASPRGLKFGPDGNLYVSSGNVIKRYDGTTGAFIDNFVTSGSGGLSTAFDLVFGPDRNLYVASFNSNQVLRYNGTTGAFLGVFASGSGLVNPHGLAFGPDGNLYVSHDPGNRIMRFNGTTGAYLDDFVPSPSGGLDFAAYVAFSHSRYAGNVISGNVQHGVAISGSGVNANVVAANFIGTDATGTIDLGNVSRGVLINAGAQRNRIGTDGDGVNDAAERNVISGNNGAGIQITGAGTNNNVVAGNYVGTDVTGTLPVGNGNAVSGAGIWIAVGAQSNVIGTDGNGGPGDAAEGNLISGNDTWSGVFIEGVGTNNNVVAGNRIGTNAAGTAALTTVVRNNGVGIEIKWGASFTRIGTNADGKSDALERNVVSGNVVHGIMIWSQTGQISQQNVVAGNYVGVDVSGTLAVGNVGSGVVIFAGSTNNVIGGASAALRNVVSGNTGNGIEIRDAGSTGNRVIGNYVGTDFTGTVDRGNAGTGVLVRLGAANNFIGTDGDGVNDASEGNLISGNDARGVEINGVDSDNNRIAGNLIGTNASGTGSVPNGTGTSVTAVRITAGAKNNVVGANGDGVSDALERNVISGNAGHAISIDAAGTDNNRVAGNYVGVDVTGAVGLDNGGWGVILFAGARNNVIGTNGDGIGDALERNVISANGIGIAIGINSGAGTGLNTDNNVIAGNYVGTNAAGTAAIPNRLNAIQLNHGTKNNRIGTNADGVSDVLERNVLSGNLWGGIVIAGVGTEGNVAAGNYVGLNAAGTAAIPNLLENVWLGDGTTNNRIGTNADGVNDAAERNVISGSALDGVVITGSNTFGHVVAGNYIGTNFDGTVDLGNVGDGIRIEAGAHDNVVGGAAFAARNVISGNNQYGVRLTGAGTTGNVVLGNYVGVNAAGTAALGNSQSGVGLLAGASSNTIGGTAAGAGNVLSGNAVRGIFISNAGTNANVIVGNFVGTNALGTAAITNGNTGILVSGGPQNNVIGGATAAHRNLVSGNTLAGIALQSTGTTGNQVLGNWLGLNAAGTAAIPNLQSGFAIIDGASANVASGNVISGNQLAGVFFGKYNTSLGVSNNVLSGNIIGTDPTGMTVIANVGPGVIIQDASANNLIGGTTAAARNVISGNTTYGVHVTGVGSTGNVVQGNLIGTDATGAGPLGNLADGLRIGNGAAGSLIGGSAVSGGNVIAFNQGAGLALTDVAAAGSTVLRNSFFANAGLGIDLGPTGVTANDAGDLDGFLNFPVFTLARIINANTELEVTGSVGAGRAVEFYLALADATGHGEGRLFLFEAAEGSGADLDAASGNFRFVVPLADLPVRLGLISGEYLTAVTLGSVSEFAFNVVIGNSSAPVPTITGVPAAAVEGTPITLESIVTDPDVGDEFQYAWFVTKNGQPFTVTGPIAESALTFTPDDNGTYQVTLIVTDLAGTTGTINATIVVANDPPRATILDAPTGMLVGATITLGSQVNDQGAADLPVAAAGMVWTVERVNADGSTSPYGSPAQGASFAFTPLANGIYTITLTVTDKDGGVGTDRASIIVSASAPTVEILGVPTEPLGEGAAIALSSAVTDPIAVDSLIYAWSVTKNGAAFAPPGLIADRNVFTFTPDDDGSYVVTLRVTNVLGVSAQVSTSPIIVFNMNPTVAITGIPALPLAGGLLTLSALVNDPGAADVHAYQWSVVNSNGQVIPGGTGSTFGFRPSAAGTYAVTVQVTDDDLGTSLDSREILVVERVVVINRTPATPSVAEGTLIDLLGSAAPQAGDTYAWTVTKNDQPYANGLGTNFAFTPDDDGDYRVRLVVTAANGSFGTANEFILGTNAAPTGAILGAPAGTVPEGTTVSLTAAASDAGAADVLSLSWSVMKFAGPPRAATGTLFATGAGYGFSFTPDDNGFYDVTLTITDDDGGTVTYLRTVEASNVAPTVRIATAAPRAANETHLVAFAFDPGAADVVNFQWSWTGPVTPQGPTNQPDFYFTHSGGSGDVVITVTATDDDGGAGTDAALIIAANDNANVITVSDSAVVIDGVTAATFDSTAIGRVVIMGGGGDDVITAAGATVAVVLDGGDGNNQLIGGDGDDILMGGAGNDTLVGGPGGDLFIGNHGDDVFEGGDGDDEYVLVPGSDITVIDGDLDGGIDVLNFSQALRAITFDLGFQGTQVVDANFNTITAFGQFEVFKGSSFGDALTVSAGRDMAIFGGGGGDEVLVLGGVNVSIYGGDDGSSGTYTLLGGQAISIFGGDGGDQVFINGSTVGITIFGGNGHNDFVIDSLSTATGITIFGGGGIDETTLAAGTRATGITIFGGDGADVTRVLGGTQIAIFGGNGADETLILGGQAISIFGGSDDGAGDLYRIAGGTQITIFGGGGGDMTILQPGSLTANVSIYGGGGDDVAIFQPDAAATGISIFGGAGNDEVRLDAGALATGITIFGGEGDDFTRILSGTRIAIFGGDGSDHNLILNGTQIAIFGGGTGDFHEILGGTQIAIFGGDAGDVTHLGLGASQVSIFGGMGSDDVTILASSVGQDVSIYGGGGDDVATIQPGAVTRGITIFGGDGNDAANVLGGMLIAIYGGEGNDQTVVGGLATMVSIFGGAGDDNATVNPGASLISIFGGDGGDHALVLGGTQIAIFGGAGDDEAIVADGVGITIYGGEEDDGSDRTTLLAGTQIAIFGGGGDDFTVINSAGVLVSAITIFGGAGNDDVSVLPGARVEGIRIYGGDGGDTTTLHAGALATGVSIFGGDGNDSATVLAGTLIAIYGGAGDDFTLLGGSVTQVSIFGGAGDDAAAIGAAASQISIFGDEGDDEVTFTGNGTDFLLFGEGGNDRVTFAAGAAAANVLIFGGAGDDVILGPLGTLVSNVVIFGGDGNNEYHLLGGVRITIFGGNDADAATLGGVATLITIFGGGGDDAVTLTGSVQQITIYGGEGNDSTTVLGGMLIAIYGGDGDDFTTVAGGPGSTIISIFGGEGNDAAVITAASQATQIAIFGGGGDDHATIQPGSLASLIAIFGDGGNDGVTIGGGTDVAIFGGDGNDSGTILGGLAVSIYGGRGNDSYTVAGGQNVLLSGELGRDLLVVEGGDGVILLGGADDDAIKLRGGTNVLAYGEDGSDLYELAAGLSGAFTLRETLFAGEAVNQFEMLASGSDTLDFHFLAGPIAVNLGTVGPQQVAPGLFLNLQGSFENVIGTSGDDVITGNAANNHLQGGAGNDQLIGLGGNDRVDGGAGNDVLIGGDGDDTYVFAGAAVGSDQVVEAYAGPDDRSVDWLDFSGLAAPVVVHLGIVGPQNVAAGLTIALTDPLGIEGVFGSPFGDHLVGNPRDNVLAGGPGDDVLEGGPGNDRYVFAGLGLGHDLIVEAGGAGAANDLRDALDFTAFGGPVNVNLAVTTPQVQANGGLVITLANGTSIEDVYGSAFGDVIIGNARDNRLYGNGGPDQVDGGGGVNVVQGGKTQVVYLDFATGTSADDYAYTAADRAAIQARLEAIFGDFFIVFTQTRPAEGAFVTITFNHVPVFDGGSLGFHGGGCNCPLCSQAARLGAGGIASELDFRNTSTGGAAYVDVNKLLGGSFQPVATSANYVAMSATIAAHELGHLLGLRHGDAFGPIGSGIYAGVDPLRYYPAYVGAVGASETIYHVMGSPASINTRLADAVTDVFLGEREAIKIAFADTGIVVPETASPHGEPGLAQGLGALPALFVPNTIRVGVNAGQDFRVVAVSVPGTILPGERDWYSFVGRAGDVYNFEAISSAASRTSQPIDTVLAVWRIDANGTRTLVAFNDDEFETRDSSIVDFVLPEDGLYYVEVSAFFATETGQYELFIYGFSREPGLGAGDAVTGRASGDQLLGSSGSDLFILIGHFTSGIPVIVGGAGADLVDASQATFDGGPGQVPVPIKPENSAPALAAVGNRAAVEGRLLSFQVAASDADLPLDRLTFTLAAPSSGAMAAGATINPLTGAFSWTPVQDGVYRVAIVVTDSSGASSQEEITITVSDAAPIANAGVNQTVVEGTAVHLTAAYFDPGALDVHALAWEVTSANLANPLTGSGGAFSFTPLQNGTYQVTLTVTDVASLQFGTSTVTITVLNAVPVVNAGAAGVTDEGTAFTSNGSFTDPGADAWTATVDYGDGGGEQALTLVGNAFTLTHVYPNEGTYQVIVRVFDGQATGVGFTTVTVKNLPPANVSAGANRTVNEGDLVALTGTFTDPGVLDGHAFLWLALRSTGEVIADSTSQTFSFVPDDDGTYTVLFKVTDDAGASATAVVEVTVNNVAPTPAITGAPSSATEGTAITLGSTVDDPGTADTFTYFWVVRLGGNVVAQGNGAGLTFTPANDGSYEVALTVTDDDGGVGTESLTIVVANVAPEVAILGAPASSFEGAAITLSSSVTDPGVGDVFTYSWTVTKNGQAFATGAGSGFTFTPNDDGSYVVTLTVSDGQASGASSRTITVLNVVPTAAITGAPSSGPEGSSITLHAAVADPGAADTFTYSWMVTKNGVAYGSGAAASFTFTPNDNGHYAVTLTVADDDGGHGGSSAFIVATNAAPVVGAIAGPAAALPGQLLTYTATFSDAGTADTHSLVIDWGDGSTTPGTISESNGAGTASGSHVYASPGAYVITFYVADDDGGVGTKIRSVGVTVTIVVLNTSSEGALALSGNATITAQGPIYVDSSHPRAITASGNAQLTAPAINVVGGVQFTGNAGWTGPLTTGAAVLVDPLAALAAPNPTGLTNYGAVNVSGNQTRTIQPGLYSSIAVSGNGRLTLLPGTYVIAGGGLSVSGNGVLSGAGVTIYNGGSNVAADTGTFGGIAFANNAEVNLSAPASGPFTGVVVFQSRQNTRAMSIGGNALAGLQGTVYAVRAALALSNNAAIANASLLVNTLTVSGNGSSTLATDGDNSHDVTVGQLLGVNVQLYVDDLTNGGFSDDQMARIAAAVGGLNGLLADYGVSITIVDAGDAALADFVLYVSPTTPNGGAADGILGSMTTGGEVIIVQGWDWYAGADPAGILEHQYDFETVVLHELGHVLGLGHSATDSSVMYGALAAGQVRRVMTVADLAIPNVEDQVYAHALVAAPFAGDHADGCGCHEAMEGAAGVPSPRVVAVRDALQASMPWGNGYSQTNELPGCGCEQCVGATAVGVPLLPTSAGDWPVLEVLAHDLLTISPGYLLSVGPVAAASPVDRFTNLGLLEARRVPDPWDALFDVPIRSAGAGLRTLARSQASAALATPFFARWEGLDGPWQ